LTGRNLTVASGFVLSGFVPAAAVVVTGLLEVRDLAVSYGHLQVLFGVDIAVPSGGAVALLGTNGAGKSTLLRAVAGLISKQAGTVTFAGDDVTDATPEELAAKGLVLIEGGRAIFGSLTVEENIRLGAYPVMRKSDDVRRRLDRAYDAFPPLRVKREQRASTLSGGEQQMVALARAIAADPTLLVIDELSLGLAPVVLGELVEVIKRLRADGVAVLLVEQSLNVAITVSDTAYFLEKGEVRFSGPTSDLVDRGDLVRSVFFGTEKVLTDATR
jgi:branched-chain amino acid transport system ATP-binding protein